MQCKARGWDELAKSIWIASTQKNPVDHFDCLFDQPTNQPPKTALAYFAWAHWGSEFAKADTDRAAIARRMKTLMETEPKLNTERHRAFWKDLFAGTVPNRAPAGSVEALVNELVDLTQSNFAFGYEENPRFVNLLERGFEAVPQLIEHHQDKRVTRAYSAPFNNSHGYFHNVGDICHRLLCDYSQICRVEGQISFSLLQNVALAIRLFAYFLSRRPPFSKRLIRTPPINVLR